MRQYNLIEQHMTMNDASSAENFDVVLLHFCS